MKTDKILHLIQQKKAMRSGGALPLPKAQTGIPNQITYTDVANKYFNAYQEGFNEDDLVPMFQKEYGLDKETALQYARWIHQNPLVKRDTEYLQNQPLPNYLKKGINYPPSKGKYKLDTNLNSKQPVVYDEYQTGGLAKAQTGLNFSQPNLGWVSQAQQRMNEPVVTTTGKVLSTGASREKERREKFIKENPNKYSIEDYKIGIKEPGLENDVLNDPIALAAALTAGGVGLGAYGVSQVPKMFATNLASEATMGLSDLTRAGLKRAAKQLPGSGNALNLEELRRAYHNSERFLNSEERRLLHKYGHGKANQYINPDRFDWSVPVRNNNQLPPPPSEIQFMPDGTTRTIYNQQAITDYVSGSYTPDYIDLRRPTQYNRDLLSEDFANMVNRYVPGSFYGEVVEQARRNLNIPAPKPKILNKSGLSKEEVLQKASAKDKDVVSKMSDTDFENSVLKPNGEIVSYKLGPEIGQMTFDPVNRRMVLKDQISMSTKEYTDAFNSRLDLLNDIIAQKNKSGVEYRVKGLDESGRLTFYTPSGQKGKNPLIKGGLEDVNIPEGESIWATNINPGQWRGDVEDIANTEYFKSIPGLEMSNTTSGVFADNVPRKGTGAYESINEYMKRLDLGRVKPGFNSQTDFSRGAWENFIKSGRGVGFYANPRTVYGTMKAIVPAAVGVGALQQIDEKQIGGSLDMKTDKLLQHIANSKQKFQKGGGIKDMVVSEIWEKVTGTKWSQAKKLGLSDGSYDTNIKLRQMLINEAMQPKPNFGKFVGKTSYVVPASSAMVNQLRQEGLAQANVQKDKTGVARPMMSPVVGPVAPKAPSKSVPLQKIVIPTNQTAPANTSAVARPAIAPVVGRVQPKAPRSVATQPVVMPTNATAPASTTGVRQPMMSPVVGRVDAVPTKAPILLDDSNFLNDVQQTFQNQALMSLSNLYLGVDEGLNVFPSAVGNYARGLAGFPITERNFTDDELRVFGRAIEQGKQKGYGVPKKQKELGYTGSFGYDEYLGGRNALNAFTGLTSPEYWGDDKAMNRIERIKSGWDALNAQYSVGMGNFKQNSDGSWTIGDRYNFNREFVKEEPTSLPEWFERKGYGADADAQTQIRIPAEYVKQKGGSKKSLRIIIRKS